MEAFDIQKIEHLLPDGIDEDLLSDLYRHTCETKQEMQDKVPANAMLAEVEQFKQLIDQLRPYLQNGFHAKVEEQMAREAELIAGFDLIGLDGEPDGNGDNYDVQENRQMAITALDRLHQLADHVAVELGDDKPGKGRPKATSRNVLLCRLYDHLLESGCTASAANIKAGQIMTAWGLPVPGGDSGDSTAMTNRKRAINQGRHEIKMDEAYWSVDCAFD